MADTLPRKEAVTLDNLLALSQEADRLRELHKVPVKPVELPPKPSS